MQAIEEFEFLESDLKNYLVTHGAFGVVDFCERPKLQITQWCPSAHRSSSRHSGTTHRLGYFKKDRVFAFENLYMHFTGASEE